MPERDDRELGLAAERLEVVVREPSSLWSSRAWPRFRSTASRIACGAVGAEREPELERAERPRVLEGDVDHVPLRALVRDVRLLVRERAGRSSRRRTSTTPQAFGRKSHLCASSVTESARSSPAKRCPADGVVAAGEPVGAVDVEPDAPLRADVGERVDRVDGTGERRARGRDDRDRRDPGRAVGVDRLGHRLRHEPAPPSIGSARTPAEPRPSSSAARSTE